MDGWRLFMSGALLAATFGILYLKSFPSEQVGNLSSRKLIIGVLSSRDHFLQRDAIRRTWGSQVSSLSNSELLFLVGEYDCPIPLEDRISRYSCERWNVLTSDIEDTGLKRFFKQSNLNKEIGTNFNCYVGISFQVLHPVLLKSISVSMDLLSRVGNCTVILQDAEEILENFQVTIRSCEEESSRSGYCELKLKYPLLLPKHFEGELRVLNTGIAEADICGQEFFSLEPKNRWVCDWTESSVIKYKYFRTVIDGVISWSGKPCPLVSAAFSVADRDVLRTHIDSQSERRIHWQEHMDFVLRKIAIEQVAYQDMLVLPHLDIYSKLPQKVLIFLKRLTLDFDFTYMMKVDDDVYVNVSSLETLISSESKHPKMWSRFHHHRSVPLWGKWADYNYPSLTYPSFPSGAAYLMSGSLVRRLAQAAPYLMSYSGEDVSIGIWMSSTVENVILVDVPCWLPRSGCQETLIISQLSPIDIMEIWNKDA